MKKKKNDNFLFNFIAPIYGLFYNSQKKNYKITIDNMHKELNLKEYENIIDVGCGTGALCSVLNQEGLQVTGIEPAMRMLKIGMKKPGNKEVNFVQCGTCSKLPFEDKSYDLSIASYVAHGLKPEERKQLFLEMGRLTKHYVIIHDYNNKRGFFTNIIEWLERGDYFNFIKVVQSELNEQFKTVKVINVKKQAAWYICEPY
ncbi:MAG: Ubiquinone/menaquinone biosynthesis C-methyltransferase UbiE [Candidatus Izimaplasma bacterium HR2]|nr:MAG: Ubiquinone/menaquinone biosynthesis C-methyltransferase UbiE [Candidatus Izimaplasma bacterium HR2]